MLMPYITSFYAALLTFLYLVLSANVIRGRLRYRIGLGDAGQDVMRRLVRSHGNFAEYVPLALLLMLLLEMTGHGPVALHALGALLLVGRVSHALGLGLTDGPSPWRLIGMLCTFAVLAVGAVLLLKLALTAWLFVD